MTAVLSSHFFKALCREAFIINNVKLVVAVFKKSVVVECCAVIAVRRVIYFNLRPLLRRSRIIYDFKRVAVLKGVSACKLSVFQIHSLYFLDGRGDINLFKLVAKAEYARSD